MALVALVGWGAPGAAAGQAPRRAPVERIVLLVPFQGPGRAGVERRVASALEAEGAEVRRLEEGGEDADGPEGAAALAAEHDVDGVIGGQTRGGSPPSLEVWIRDPDGAEVARIEGPLIGRQAVETLRLGLTEGMVALPSRAPPEPEPAPPPPLPAAVVPAAQPVPAPEGGSAADPQAASAAPWLRLAARATAGIRDRRVDLRSEDGRGASFDSGVYPDLGLEVEARAWGFAFVRLALASSVGLDTQDPSGDGSTRSHFTRFEATAALRGVLLEALEVGAGLGFLLDHYGLDFNRQLASATYPSLRPVLYLGAVILPRVLEVQSTFGLRFPLGLGDLPALFGVDNSAIGYDVGGRIQGRVDVGLTWGVEAVYRRYDLTFGGRGDTPLSGADRGFAVTGLLGYELVL